MVIGEGLSSLMLSKLLLDKGYMVNFFRLEPDVERLPGISVCNAAPGIGTHNYYIESPADEKFLHHFFKLNLTKRKQNNYLYINAKRLAYPLKISGIIKAESFCFFLKATISYLKAVLRPRKINSYRSLVENSFGECLYEYYFKNYLSHEYVSVDPDTIDPELARRRIKYVSLKYIIANLFKKNIKSCYNTETYFFPENGVVSYINVLQKELVENPALVCYQPHSFSISCSNQKYVITYASGSSQKKLVVDHIFANTGVNELMQALGNKTEIFEKWNPVYIMSFLIDEKNFRKDENIYCADRNVFFYQVSVNRDIKSGLTVVTGFAGGQEHKTMPGNAKSLAIESIINLGIISSEMSVLGFSHNILIHGKPLLLRGKYSLLKEARTILQSQYGINLFGERPYFREISFSEDVKQLNSFNQQF